jgi:hypothetical protein
MDMANPVTCLSVVRRRTPRGLLASLLSRWTHHSKEDRKKASEESRKENEGTWALGERWLGSVEEGRQDAFAAPGVQGQDVEKAESERRRTKAIDQVKEVESRAGQVERKGDEVKA